MTRVFRICLTRLTIALFILILLLRPVSAGPLTQSMPHVTGTRAIVLEQLEALLSADKELQFVGLGSWLRSGAQTTSKAGGVSRAYGDPLLGGTSDHDLRLVMQGKDEAAMASRWIDAQTKLKKGIQSLFPSGSSPKAIEETLLRYGFSAEDAARASKLGAAQVADAVLQSVNIYAPPQLMKFVVDEKTAAATFKKLGAVPNLGGRVVEGVWGEGSLAATQEFEAGGRLFYSGQGGVRSGFVDLVHMSEEYGRYSFGGAANMSVQWAEKAAEAMSSGDLSLVAKYMKRLKATWTLAIRKGGLKSGAMRTSLTNLNAFIAAAEQGESAVLEGGLNLQKFLRTARMQSSVLGQLARNSGSVDREIMLAILEAQPLSRWEKVGTWFRDVWPSAENLAIFERTLQGAFLALSTWQVSGTWGEKGMEDALRQAGVEGAMLVSLPVGALMSLTNSFIENAKEFGYNSAVKPQEWREFLVGISSVTGYEGMTNVELSIEKLAVMAVSPASVQRAVEVQAFNISRLKETGAPESEETTAAREVIKNKLIAKMTPIVLAEWLRERKRLITIYLDHALDLDARMTNLILTVKTSPEPVALTTSGPADATAQLMTSEDLGGIQDLLARMEAAIRPLGGRQHIVPFSYRATLVYEQDGKVTEISTSTNLKDLLVPQTFRVSGRGSFPLAARFKLELRAPSLGTMDEARDVYDVQPLLTRTYERKIPFAITVTAPSKGHWKFAAAENFELRQDGKQEAQVCRGCAPAWTVGEMLFTESSIISRESGTKDYMPTIYKKDNIRKPYTIEQVLSWTGLPDTIVPGVTYTSTATLSWTTSDAALVPAADAYRSARVTFSLPSGQQFLEPDRSKPQVSAQWKGPEPSEGAKSGAAPDSFTLQIQFGGPGGSVHRMLRWNWVVDVK